MLWGLHHTAKELNLKQLSVGGLDTSRGYQNPRAKRQMETAFYPTERTLFLFYENHWPRKIRQMEKRKNC